MPDFLVVLTVKFVRFVKLVVPYVVFAFLGWVVTMSCGFLIVSSLYPIPETGKWLMPVLFEKISFTISFLSGPFIGIYACWAIKNWSELSKKTDIIESRKKK